MPGMKLNMTKVRTSMQYFSGKQLLGQRLGHGSVASITGPEAGLKDIWPIRKGIVSAPSLVRNRQWSL